MQKKRKFRDFNYSSIDQHKKSGKVLIPPFNTLPGANKVSWRDDVAPEMFWAFVVAQSLPRKDYLQCFRQVVVWCKHNLPGPAERDEANNGKHMAEIAPPPWQEYVDVNTGHWANKNLRMLAVEGGIKDVYDKYYDWTSTYSHGHWGAIRDSNFVTCFNPLHRFHRIPRISHRVLPAIAGDAISLVNSLLDILQKLYPALPEIPRLSRTKD